MVARTKITAGAMALALVLLLISWAGFTTSVHAQGGASAWSDTPQTTVRLIAPANTHKQTTTLTLGLHFKMDPGWKIYWRSPGDAGFPPRINWKGSSNVADSTTHWPIPERFSILGLETLGYKDEVVLPMTVELIDGARPADLNARVDFLTCKDICIPHTANLDLVLPPGDGTPTQLAHLLSKYQAKVPSKNTAVGLDLNAVEAFNADGKPMLRVRGSSTMPMTDPDVFIEGPEDFIFGTPTMKLTDGQKQVEFLIPINEVGASGLYQSIFTFTLVDGSRALEAASAAERGAALPLEASAPIFVILGLALLGGLILNLMPCVLPVLSIKLLGIIRQGGRETRDVRRSFVATSAGILFAFMVLAAALAGLKLAGVAIGWGIQFQQPWFLVTMAVIITAFAANLWGVFQIPLPGWVSTLNERATYFSHGRMSYFERSRESHSLTGDFMTGCLATLLATPCSAPFLGTAVGFALSQGISEIFLIFVMLGLGLALPYLAVAVYPKIAARLPKPGPWMVTLRRILGFAMAATAAWLVSVLYVQAGLTAAIALGSALILVVAFLFARSLSTGTLRKAAGALVMVSLIAAIAAPVYLSGQGQGISLKDGRLAWRTFDSKAINQLVADGQVVFVDVTAEWCITCLANKRLVLYTDKVQTAFKSDNVIPMLADWTNPDDAISRYLASYGRYGIPFNAVYGPGAPEGIVLSELLSTDEVLNAIEKARGGARASNDPQPQS